MTKCAMLHELRWLLLSSCMPVACQPATCGLIVFPCDKREYITYL